MVQDIFFAPGHILSDGLYEIKQKLGQGGMGVVYKGISRSLKTDVALKFQLPDAHRDAKVMFRREAIAMAKLAGHSNLVSIFHVGLSEIRSLDGEEPANYIACEYIEGETAVNLAQKTGKSLEEVMRCMEIGVAVCNGLAYAHEHSERILHRDIKPSNILLGKNGIVKVSDFGLVKIITNTADSATARFWGTPLYMAPEQFDDHNPNTKIDIWQLGATLYELFTGSLPFPGMLQQPFPKAPKSKPEITPIDINSNIPKGVSECLMAMLSIDPDARPRDCKEIRDQLKEEIDKLDPAKRKIQEENIRYLPPLVNIRRALKDNVEQGIQSLVDSSDGGSILPKQNEKQKWYATVLMRPANKIGGKRNLANKFNPVFFAEYEGSTRVAYSDWEDEPNLIAQPLSIYHSCVGLPIRWYSERGQWSSYEGSLYDCNLDRKRFIRDFALKNVKYARFEDPESNLIKSCYATDESREGWCQAVGWELKTENGHQRKSMSQDIETEIIIPIYSPFSKSAWGSSDEILGVANFEWEEKFPDWRIKDLGQLLAAAIQDENFFALSEFICDILPNLTLAEDDEE
jgi:serine/threonine protein kinase